MKKIVIVDGGPRKNMNTAQLLQRDAIVRITLGSICTSDLHIKHGCVPRAVPGITDGHEMVGIVEALLDDLMQNGVYTPRKRRF